MSKEKFDQRFNEAWNMQPPYVVHQRSRGDIRLVPNPEVASPAEPPEQGEKVYPAWVVGTLREKLRSLSYGPEQGQPFNQPEPPYEFKMPTEETFRIRAFVYDAIAKQSTVQDVGVLHIPIDPEQFVSRPDVHPPMRDCDCKDCTNYFDEKDLSPSDGAIYAAASLGRGLKEPVFVSLSTLLSWNKETATKMLDVLFNEHVADWERHEAQAYFLLNINTDLRKQDEAKRKET